METIPSGREMADVAARAGAIDMAQGVVHLPPPKMFSKLLRKHFNENITHVYASPAGYIKYREELVKMLKDEMSDISLDNVMATNGVTGGLVSALRAHCKPFDKVALLEPFYPAHDWAIQALALITTYVPYAEGFTLDFEKIEEALKEVRAFVLANPGNPTGLLVEKDDLIKIHSLCKKNDVLLIVDEVYMDFIWEGEFISALAIADDLDNLVVLRSFSKNLALAGWRVGYAVTSAERRAHMTHIHDALYVGAPEAAQVVMADILSKKPELIEDFISGLLRLYAENREAIASLFKDYGMTPLPKQGAYYMMVEHHRESDSSAMRELLDKGVAVAPGTPFYRPGVKDTGYIRVHFALSKKNLKKVAELLVK